MSDFCISQTTYSIWQKSSAVWESIAMATLLTELMHARYQSIQGYSKERNGYHLFESFYIECNEA